jgi:tRNA pseudouridine38-40 synthase
MNYYRATLQYDGTEYFGFQWQKGIPSVQNDLNLALEKILDGKITTMSASRTDSGVHAVDQVVKITTEFPFECGSFLINLNETLPPSIRCMSLSECEGSFRPNTDSLSKEYRYFFTNRLKETGLDQRFIANNPFEINIKLMRESAGLVVGKHDFHNFYSAGSNVKSTIREISSCELTEVNPHEVFPKSNIFILPPELKNCYQLRIEGNGFLKQMVRHLMSALWLVGGGKLSVDEFSRLLAGPAKKRRLWKVASPRGLFLYRIIY